MERGDRTPVATFYAPELSPGVAELLLGEQVAHHAAVRRLSEGDALRLTNGAGVIGFGTIGSLRKRELVAEIRRVQQVPRPPLLEVLPPIADRDRMLWLAEKCAEMAVTLWQPVAFSRSRSVTPRGEGEPFAAKVRARMIAALEQSGGAWLPDIRREREMGEALSTPTARDRFVLDPGGEPIAAVQANDGVAVTFGPEGGLIAAEQAVLEAAGWRRLTLGPTTLRFETAGIAAVAILRAGMLTANSEG